MGINIYHSPKEEFIHDLIVTGRATDPVIARLIEIIDSAPDVETEFYQRFGELATVQGVWENMDGLESTQRELEQECKDLTEQVKYLQTRSMLQAMQDLQKELDAAKTEAATRQSQIYRLNDEKQHLKDRLETWTILSTWPDTLTY